MKKFCADCLWRGGDLRYLVDDFARGRVCSLHKSKADDGRYYYEKNSGSGDGSNRIFVKLAEGKL